MGLFMNQGANDNSIFLFSLLVCEESKACGRKLKITIAEEVFTIIGVTQVSLQVPNLPSELPCYLLFNTHLELHSNMFSAVFIYNLMG